MGGGAEEVELDLLAEVEVRNEVGGEPLVADTNDGPHHLAGDDTERVQVVIQRRLKHHPTGDGGVRVLDVAPHGVLPRGPVTGPGDGVVGVQLLLRPHVDDAVGKSRGGLRVVVEGLDPHQGPGYRVEGVQVTCHGGVLGRGDVHEAVGHRGSGPHPGRRGFRSGGRGPQNGPGDRAQGVQPAVVGPHVHHPVRHAGGAPDHPPQGGAPLGGPGGGVQGIDLVVVPPHVHHAPHHGRGGPGGGVVGVDRPLHSSGGLIDGVQGPTGPGRHIHSAVGHRGAGRDRAVRGHGPFHGPGRGIDGVQLVVEGAHEHRAVVVGGGGADLPPGEDGPLLGSRGRVEGVHLVVV